jgi:hypothetical protein
LITDGYFVCWAKSVTLQLPPKFREASIAALLGFGNRFKRQLSVGALKAKEIVKKGGKAAGLGVKKMAGLVKQK